MELLKDCINNLYFVKIINEKYDFSIFLIINEKNSSFQNENLLIWIGKYCTPLCINNFNITKRKYEDRVLAQAV